MSDEPTTVTPAGDEPKAEPTPQPGGDEPPKGDEPKAKTYTQAELDKITSSGEKTRIKLENENKALREAAMSDDDKKLQAAREEGAAEWKQKFEGKLRQDDISSALLDSGVNPKRVRHALLLGEQLFPEDEPAQVAEQLEAQMPELFGSTKGQFGPADGKQEPTPQLGRPFTRDVVSKILDNMSDRQGHAWYLQHQGEIRDDQNEEDGVRTVGPGKGMH